MKTIKLEQLKFSKNGEEIKVNGVVDHSTEEALEIIETKKDEVLNAVPELRTAINVERERINNLTKLPSGSTTADAELTDIRVGADGKTYSTAGTAVREQISNVKKDLGDLDTRLFETININMIQGLLTETGENSTSTNAAKSDKKSWLTGGSKIIIKKVNPPREWYIYFYRKSTDVQAYKRSEKLVPTDNDISYMIDSGCYIRLRCSVVNVSEIGGLINEISVIRNSVANKLDKTGGTVSKIPFGTKNDACILNINSEGTDADIMGFTDDSEVATYHSRDAVGLYMKMQENARMYITPTSFDETHVYTNNVINKSIVGVGSVIDAYDLSYSNKNKYSGIVTKVSDGVIEVSGWYKYGNTEKGQIPAGMQRVVLNPHTKIWGMNINTFLKSNSIAKQSVIGEFGLFAEDEDQTANGLDVILFEGKSDFGFQTRKSTLRGEKAVGISTGYRDIESSVSFESIGAKIAFLIEGMRSDKGIVAINRESERCFLETTGDGRFNRLVPNILGITEPTTTIDVTKCRPVYAVVSPSAITVIKSDNVNDVEEFKIAVFSDGVTLRIGEDEFEPLTKNRIYTVIQFNGVANVFV